MKALRTNPADLLGVTLLSIGTLSLGLLSGAGFDLISEPFGVLMVWSRGVGAAAGLVILYRWMTQQTPQREYVRVRA